MHLKKYLHLPYGFIWSHISKGSVFQMHFVYCYLIFLYFNMLLSFLLPINKCMLGCLVLNIMFLVQQTTNKRGNKAILCVQFSFTFEKLSVQNCYGPAIMMHTYHLCNNSFEDGITQSAEFHSINELQKNRKRQLVAWLASQQNSWPRTVGHSWIFMVTAVTANLISTLPCLPTVVTSFITQW